MIDKPDRSRRPADDASEEGVQVSLSSLIALRDEAKQLDIAPRGRAMATRAGGHLSRFRGRGIEFDESRAYQPGDDPRSMDWRVTARAGTPHVKLFREERERPVWLFVDRGLSMRFGTRVAFKSVIASRAAALLGWASIDRGDRIGGLIFDEQNHFERRPAARQHGLLPLLRALATAPRPGGGGYGDFQAAVDHLVRLVRPGSLVFLLSDFVEVQPGKAAWLSHLGGASEVVLVAIVDPLEENPPPPGTYPITDGERRGVLDTRSRSARGLYQGRYLRRRAALEELSKRHNTHLLTLRTVDPVGPTLARGLGRPGRGRVR